MRERIARSVFWIAWSRGAIQLISFLSTIFVARLLEPTDYGLMAIAGVCTSMVGLLAEFGLGAAIVQFRDVTERELNACFWITLGLAVLGYAALLLAAPAIGRWFDSDRLPAVLRVVGLTLPLTAARVVPDSLLRKRLELDKSSRAEIAAVLATIPVVVGLAVLGAGVWALVAGECVLPTVQGAMSFWFVRWRPGLVMRSTRIADIVGFSLAALGSRVCWGLYVQADRLVLGRVAGDTAVGVYSMAKQLATLPADRLTAAANQLVVPAMAELQRDLERLRVVLRRALRLVASASWPLTIGVMLTAHDAILLLLTDKWLPAVPVLRLLCLYAVMHVVGSLCAPVLMALYRANVVFRYTLSQLVVMPLAFVLGAWWLGGLGVAIAWVSVYPVALVWLANRTLRELSLRWRPFLAELRPAACATAVMTVVVVAVQWMLAGTGTVGARLALTVMAGAFAYGASLYVAGGPAAYAEITEVAAWLLPPRGRAPRADGPPPPLRGNGNGR
jgi:O-antigen/teichoic acid export membrane protein